MVREGAFGQLKEGGGFCLEDASAARRIRRRQPLLVSFYITFALKKGIRLRGKWIWQSIPKLEIGVTELR